MNDKEFSSINIIPLVDIMLVLLVIVLITATFVVQGNIPVQLPQARSNHQQNLKGLNITIQEDGRIFFDGQPIDLINLEHKITTYSKDTQIIIFADKSAKVQYLVSLLDILKRLDFKNVSIKTQISQ